LSRSITRYSIKILLPKKYGMKLHGGRRIQESRLVIEQGFEVRNYQCKILKKSLVIYV
jgi:hypothetical protein